MILTSAWKTLWTRNAQTDPLIEFNALSQLYSQPHRAYHNLAHVEDCLNQFEESQVAPQNEDAVKLALWLHDVIYEIGAADNEEQSAKWATDALARGDAPADLTETVADLILATRHPSNPQTADAKLVVDIDLSILGRDRAAFMQYEDRIRREYQSVPAARYRAGRAKILQGFLERPSIYFTDIFWEKYEAEARANLAWSIARLARDVGQSD